MTIKVTNAPIQKIISSDRFEPRFHSLFNKFDEYEQTSRYQIMKLGDNRILRKITDGEHAGQVFVEKGIRFIKNSAVKDFSINLFDGFYITEEKHKQLKRSALKPLDVLFTTVGHLGSTAIIPEHFGEANINQNVVKIEIDENFINPYYLAIYLNSSTTKKQISALFTGNIHSILTYPKIKNIRIIIPDKSFQDQIAEKYKKAIEFDKKSLLLLSKAQNLLYEKLTIDFSKIKKKNFYSVNLSDFIESDLWTPSFSFPLYVNTLNEIQKRWKTVSLGEISTVKKGDEVGSNNYNEYLDKKDSDVPFIRTSDLVNYEIDQFPDYYIPEEIYHELKQDIKHGDVIFTKDGKIGMIAMITKNDKAVIASGITRLRLKAEAKKYNITHEYLFSILSLKETGLYPSIRRTVTASTIPHLREERLKEFEIPILDEKSISEITEFVKEAFELKDKRKIIIKSLRSEIDTCFEI